MGKFDTVILIIRLLNAGLSLAVLAVMTIRFNQWRSLSPGDFRFRIGSLLLLAAVCYASVEAALLQTTSGARSIVTLLALLFLTYAALTIDNTRDRK